MTTDRYHRQRILPGIGDAGQERIARSRVAIIGVGALGCALADMLARAGVGRLVLIDRDIVESTNLQRQVLFDEADAAARTPKAIAAKQRLARINSSIHVTAEVADLGPEDAEELIGLPLEEGETLIIADGTDNIDTRYILNDVAVKHGVPYVYGGVVATRGMQATFLPSAGPCLRCLFPEPPPPGTLETCDTAGVLGPAVQIVAAAQAADVLKIAAGAPGALSGTMLEFDVWSNTRRRLDLKNARDPSCTCCGGRIFEFLDKRRGFEAKSLCGQHAVQIRPAGGRHKVDLTALAQRLRAFGGAEVKGQVVRANLREEGLEIAVFADGRAIVYGTDRPETARTVFSRYVGV